MTHTKHFFNGSIENKYCRRNDAPCHMNVLIFYRQEIFSMWWQKIFISWNIVMTITSFSDPDNHLLCIGVTWDAMTIRHNFKHDSREYLSTTKYESDQNIKTDVIYRNKQYDMKDKSHLLVGSISMTSSRGNTFWFILSYFRLPTVLRQTRLQKHPHWDSLKV